MGLHVGIDLGTCYSAIAYFDRRYNKPVMINNSMNKTITPSVLYFDGDEVHFGEYAKSMRAFESEKAVSHFKQEMGTPGYCVQFGVNTYNAEDLSKIFLQKLVADAEESIGQKISSAVITVPAYFNHQQREATRRAGERAGLEVLQIINEPTAAAIAYGLLGDLLPQTILVYDLGGGTFDVTLMSISNNGIDVLATGGDHRLGGKNWDDAIALYLNGLFQAEHGIDIFDDFADCYDLQLKSEAAKVQLTLRDKVNVSLTYKGKRGSYEITLDTFNDITRDLMKRTEAFVEDVLYEKNLTWADIDGVLLVGGSSRMRMVPEFVRAMSGKEPLKTGIYVDDAVAQGAAILAEIQKARESGNLPAIEGKTITDVTAHSLGMVAISRDRSKFINEILIRHNSRIPAQKTEPFKVSRKNCRNGETDIYVLQGESQRPLDCQILGKYVVSDIDLSSQKEAVIDVTYSYDIDGIVHVGAFQQKANKQLPVRVEPVPADMSWLDQSPDEMIKVPEQVSIILAVDLSGSMYPALGEVQRAMNNMVDNLSAATVKIGLIAFADRVQMMCELTEDKKAVAKEISRLSIESAWNIGVGGGNNANPFLTAYNTLKYQPGKRIIVVLADGVWNYQDRAIADARKCIKENIEVIAIGFAEANEGFLKKISSSDENALYTSLDNLADSFINIAQVISESSLSSR